MIEVDTYCRFYKNLAVGVLSECYSSDQYKATLLVVHQMSNYGCVTPLQLAVLADNKNFVAHPVCQNVLTTIWFGRLKNDNSYLKVVPLRLLFLCLLLLGLLLLMLLLLLLLLLLPDVIWDKNIEHSNIDS